MQLEILLPLGKVDPGLRTPDTPLDITTVAADGQMLERLGYTGLAAQATTTLLLGFYEIEATQSGWSLPELKRQVASALYERLALSRDKEERPPARERGAGADPARGHTEGAVCPGIPRLG